MRPLVIITPVRIYMDLLRPSPGRSCVVRPNMELNDCKFSQEELVCAHRYVAQEGWTEYANGLWKPDPELSRFMDDSLRTNGGSARTARWKALLVSIDPEIPGRALVLGPPNQPPRR